MAAAGYVVKNLYAGVVLADEARKPINPECLAWTAGVLRLSQTAVYQMGPEPEFMPAEKNQKGPLNKPVLTVRQD